MTTTIRPGDIVLDYSGLRLTDAQADEAHKQGVKAVVRYSAGIASDPGNVNHARVAWKLITPAEFKFLRSHGLDIIANDEWYESRVTEGAAAGKADGTAAARHWKSCGYAKGAAIYPSWDAAPVPSQWPAVDAYMRAYARAAWRTGGYTVGLYAGTPYLRHVLALRTKLRRREVVQFGWRPNAGSWSNDGLPYQPDASTQSRRDALVAQALKVTPAHVYQDGNYWFNKGADENIVLRVPVGSHLWALTPPPEQPPLPPLKPPAQDQPNIDAAREALQKASKQHPKPGPVGRAVRAALKALRALAPSKKKGKK